MKIDMQTIRAALIVIAIVMVIFLIGRASAEGAPKGTIIFNPPLTQPAPEPRKWVPWCERFRNPHITSPNRCGEPKRRVTPRPEPEHCQWEIRGVIVTGRCELNPWITAWQEAQG